MRLLLLALVSLLPDPGAALPLRSYYFRDFTVTFYPQRAFAAAELGAFRVPLWNPFVHEGTFALPSFYPGDLLAVPVFSPSSVSWLLTLHFPFAALGAYALARELGARRWGAFGAGVVYSLCGLAVSSLNLFVFLQAMAWAPLTIVLLARSARSTGRAVVAAALAVAVSMSTLAIEFVVQAVVLGVLLGVAGAGSRKRAGLRLAAALLLGAGLASVPLVVTAGALDGSVRGAGFERDVALGNELHPMALLQTLVPGLFGSLAFPVEAWWGGGFFSKGFPYFLSLYLGVPAALLACVGVSELRGWRRAALGVPALLAFWYALGRRGGLATLVAALPGLEWFRFPSKALLCVVLVVSMCAGLGLSRLARGEGWRTLGWGGLLSALALFGFGLFSSSGARLEALGFVGTLPRDAIAASVSRDCFTSAAVALSLAAAALARRLLRGRISAPLVAVMALLVFDLVRSARGVNPQVSPAFHRLLPELHALVPREGRVFSYGLDESPAYRRFLNSGTPGIGLWSFFLSRQMLVPYTSALDRIETASGKDLTGFTPAVPEIGPGEYDPRHFESILPRLRDAAVSTVLSLDPISHPALKLLAAIPSGAGELKIHAYGLDSGSPRVYVACRLFRVGDAAEARTVALSPGFDPGRDVVLEAAESAAGAVACRSRAVSVIAASPTHTRYQVEADAAAHLVVRDSYAPAWTALVDGEPAQVLRANGRHRAVAVPAGRHDVVLSFRPRHLSLALLATALSGLVVLGMAFGTARRGSRGGG